MESSAIIQPSDEQMNSEVPVFQRLMNDIMNEVKEGRLRAGDRLPPEREWAKAMGVSRAAVREAVRALEALGLLEGHQGSGTYISNTFHLAFLQPMTISYFLGGGTVQTLQEFRRALEIESAKIAAMNCTPAYYAELLTINKQMESAETEELSAQYDRDFHRKIVEMTGNCLLIDSMASIYSLLDSMTLSLRKVIHRENGDSQIVFEQHRAILEAIGHGNPMLARNCMREHMNLIEDYLEKVNETGMIA
ncbi:MAG: FadR/GntR family transcriptional regulator [Eubacterium sp.]|nr:FadR/GntR family transcriptional regulator [Eubacterium sp.]